jgi:hypothetical protein
MDNEHWEVLDQVSGSAIAEMIKGMLEAQGFQVVLSQEGVGESVFPVALGTLSEIQILVPEHQLEEAKKVMAAYNAGEFEDLPDEDYIDENGAADISPD